MFSGDFPKLKGWSPAGGAADLFLACGFENLMVRDVRNKDLIVTVNIYCMGSRLNAYCMYRTEQPDVFIE